MEAAIPTEDFLRPERYEIQRLLRSARDKKVYVARDRELGCQVTLDVFSNNAIMPNGLTVSAWETRVILDILGRGGFSKVYRVRDDVEDEERALKLFDNAAGSTDLFAVGVVLYRLLCNGHHPYPYSKPMVAEPVIDPRTIRSDLNPDLAEFLIKACAPARADRFATAAEMQHALRNTRADL